MGSDVSQNPPSGQAAGFPPTRQGDMKARRARKVSAHVMEGVSRFEQPDKAPDLFIDGEAAKALEVLHHKLEFFPTPPWNVRAMADLYRSLFWSLSTKRVLEPAAGRGHIVEPLSEVGRDAGFDVAASDIHDHGKGYGVCDFLSDDFPVDWASVIVTNPPFKLADAFVRKALTIAPHVIVLCRLSFLNSAGRFDLHFNNPAGHLRTFSPCIERVPMVLGRCDPKISTATEFAWFHYMRGYDGAPDVRPIPPGSRARFERKEDVRI